MDKQINDYICSIDDERRPAVIRLMDVIDKNIPKGFEKGMQFAFPSYYVPLETYPKGYHGNTSEPLPFLSVGAQKKYISLYHMGIYANPKLLEWFQLEYPKHMATKLNMGKSCIRFANPDKLPYELIGQLVAKMTPEEWIAIVDHV